NLTTDAAVPFTPAISFAGGVTTVTLPIPTTVVNTSTTGYPLAGVLPDGYYQLRILPGTVVSNDQTRGLNQEFSSDIFFLSGDVSHDRWVSVDDLFRVASNYDT